MVQPFLFSCLIQPATPVPLRILLPPPHQLTFVVLVPWNHNDFFFSSQGHNLIACVARSPQRHLQSIAIFPLSGGQKIYIFIFNINIPSGGLQGTANVLLVVGKWLDKLSRVGVYLRLPEGVLQGVDLRFSVKTSASRSGRWPDGGTWQPWCLLSPATMNPARPGSIDIMYLLIVAQDKGHFLSRREEPE